jgi:hypothetical protein
MFSGTISFIRIVYITSLEYTNSRYASLSIHCIILLYDDLSEYLCQLSIVASSDFLVAVTLAMNFMTQYSASCSCILNIITYPHYIELPCMQECIMFWNRKFLLNPNNFPSTQYVETL